VEGDLGMSKARNAGQDKKSLEGKKASEALSMFDDLPDGAALAAAADSLGVEYDEYIDMLAKEQGENHG
jgi:hypothetical protein